jgi:2-dehydropantoate 2-reductase
MKIAVMAAGGLGGFFGALLARNGNEVTLIARGAHLEAIRKNGLAIKSTKGDYVIKPAKATENPAEAGVADWILFAVKTYDTETAARALKPMVGENTTIVTVQNGVESFDQLAALYGKERVLLAPTQIESSIVKPGVIAQTSSFITTIVGGMDKKITARVEWFVEQLKKSGVDITASDQMPVPVWNKMLFLSSFSGLTTLARTEGAVLFKSPEARATLRTAMREVYDVALAYGVKMQSEIIEQRVAFSAGIQPGMTSSMHKDLMNHKRLEIDALSGAIVRLGEAKGIATPVHQTIYVALKMEDERAKSGDAQVQ